MQEGFIFSDTNVANIAFGVDVINKERLVYAADVANIKEYISELPLVITQKLEQKV